MEGHSKPRGADTLLFLFYKQELQTRRDRWAATSGEVSLGEERQVIDQKLVSWLLTEFSDAETNKQLNEYWVTIEGIPLGYRTSDLARLLGNTPLCIDIRDSFEECICYGICLGNKWDQVDLLQWFEAKPRRIDGTVVVVSKWTYEFHSERLFSELSRLLHARERRNDNRKAVCAPPLPFKGEDTVSTSTVMPTTPEPNPTAITQPTTAVTSSHQGQTVSSVQAPTQDYDRTNPRWGSQYGHQSNDTPTHNYWEPLSSQSSYDMDKRYDSGHLGTLYGQRGSWYANTEYARTPLSSGKGYAKPQIDWPYGRSAEYGKPPHSEMRPSYGNQYGFQHSEGSAKGKGKDGQITYKGGKGNPPKSETSKIVAINSRCLGKIR